MLKSTKKIIPAAVCAGNVETGEIELVQYNDPVEIKNELQPFDEHKPLDKLAVKKKLQLINPSDIQSIENLGEQYSGILQNLSASLAQSDTKLKSMGEIGNNITSLMSTVKTLDPELINNKPSFIGKLFGKAKDGVTTFIDKQKTVDEAVQEVSTRLLDDRQELINENIALEKTYVDNIRVLNEMDVVIETGLADAEVLKMDLQEFQASKTELSAEDALEIQSKKHFIERFEQKLSRLNNAKALVLRQLPQIRIMQSGNNTEIDTIKDVVDIAVPLWKSQLNLYISQLKTKNAVDTRKSVTDTINSTIQKNAQLMNQNVTDIASGYTSDIITSETIKVVNDNLLSSINTMNESTKVVKQKREEAFLAIKQMDNELKQIQLN